MFHDFLFSLHTLRTTTRFRHFHPDIFQFVSDNVPNAETTLIQEQVIKDIQRLIQELPQDQKEVIIMRLYRDMSFKEIAENTNVSINTALGRMRYAIINLRKMIEENQIIIEV